MKNLKRALSLVLSAAMMVGMMVVGTGAAELKDVKGHANQEAAELMAMIGVMEGDGEKFNPDNVITRNEMAVVMCNLLDLKLNGAHPFTDVASWADKYVAAIYTNGYTAGKTATTFGGSDKITTAEAALMIMKTLGYFEFQGEFGSDWKLATVKRATELQLFDDVDAGINDYMTRGEVAQMVMNVLDEDVVVAYEQGGMSVEGNGITVTQKPEYTYYVTDDANRGRTANVTLMDKLYDYTLSVDATDYDAFGRPATTWTYTGGEKASDSVTVADKAKIVFTTKQDDDKIEKALKGYTYAAAGERVVVDGAKSAGAFVYNTVVKAVANSDADLAGETGNGARVEIFANKQNEITDIVVINEYVNKITAVTDGDEAKGIDRKVTVNGMDFKTENFAKKDWVKYTMANGEIKSMVAAETKTGKVTAEATGYIKLDGVTYKPNAQYTTLASDINLGDNVVVFVDSYGFILGLKEKVSADADLSDYVLVIDAGNDNWGREIIKVLYADGTKADLYVDPDSAVNAATVYRNVGTMFTVKQDDDGFKFSALVTTKEADGKFAGYDEYAETPATDLTYNKKNGTLGIYRIADDAAVFYLNTKGNSDPTDDVYKVMTGAELKKLDEASVSAVSFLYANKETTGYKYAELIALTVSATDGTGDLLYGYVTADTESVKNADDKTVDSITFWNGKENVTVLASDATTGLAKGEFFSYKLTAKGAIDKASITKLSAKYAVSAFDGKKVELTDNTTTNVYDITADSVIIYVNVKDKVGVAASEIAIADKNAAETAYIMNVIGSFKVDANGDDDVKVLFVDVKNKI